MFVGLKWVTYTYFRPLLQALFNPTLSFDLRWRLLAFQPLNFLVQTICQAPFLISRPFTVEYLPILPGRHIRALVFRPPPSSTTSNGSKLHPLHVDIHSGAFIGGIAEGNAAFCTRLARKTSAVVVSIEHRLAPEWTFPAAHDDVDATLRWLRAHAQERYNADPGVLTTSGSSAGGNLALATSQGEGLEGAVKGCVTFYAAIDLRLRPEDKPKSGEFPKNDPMTFMLPLYDQYAGPVRAANLDNPRMSPAIADSATLPERILLVVPGIDIVVQEQLQFAGRVRMEWERDERMQDRRIDVLFEEKMFHGYLEVPDSVISKEQKERAFDAGINMIREVHEKHGWSWEE